VLAQIDSPRIGHKRKIGTPSIGRRTSHRMNRMYGVALALALPLFAGAPAAPAQERLPDDNAGTGQYVEPVPDAGGDRPASPGGADGPAGSLPPGTRSDLPPGEEGRVLERLATDPGSGASGSGQRERGTDRRAEGDSLPGDDRSAASAVTSAVTDSDSPAGKILVAGMLLLTAALAGAGFAWRRRRQGI
jgi:MYXO-CTERM domain-containing protein